VGGQSKRVGRVIRRARKVPRASSHAALSAWCAECGMGDGLRRVEALVVGYRPVNATAVPHREECRSDRSAPV
jgi:hypothetical protein